MSWLASCFHSHLKWVGLYDTQDNRRKTVLVLRGVARDARGPPAYRDTSKPGRFHTSAACRSASERTRRSGESNAWRRLAAPSSLVPSTSWLLASMGTPPSVARHLPMRSKFSSENPIGSMILWHAAHTGFLRCCLHALAHRGGLLRALAFGQRRHVRAEAAAGACPECSPESISRAPPARSGWPRTSPAESFPGPANRGGHHRSPGRDGSGFREHWECRRTSPDVSLTNV